MNNLDGRLIQVIDVLTKAVNVCYEVDLESNDNDRSYPFATGYSRSAMNFAIDDLSQIVSELRKDLV